jgi:hypothetical protein
LPQPKNLHWKTEDKLRETASLQSLTHTNRPAKYKVWIAVIDSTFPGSQSLQGYVHFGDGSPQVRLAFGGSHGDRFYGDERLLLF